MADSKDIMKALGMDMDISTEFDASFVSDSAGFEGVDQECTRIPFLKIAQPTSDELKRGNAKYMPELSMGMYFSPLARKVYGERIRLVILKFYRNFAVYDGENPQAKFQGSITVEEFKRLRTRKVRSYNLDERGWRYVDTRNFVVVNYDALDDGPMLYAMASTGIGPSKTILTLAENIKVDRDGKKILAPIWSSVWELGLSMLSSENGDYYQVTQIERKGWVRKDLAGFFKDAFEALQATDNRTIVADDGSGESIPHAQDASSSPAEDAVVGAFGKPAGRKDEGLF